MATRVGTGCHIKDIVKFGDPYNAPLSAIIWVMSLRKPDMANFVLKSANFCYHGNKGRSEHSLADTIKSGDPQNPLLGASIWAISLTPAEL